jgi:hypothetical protein
MSGNHRPTLWGLCCCSCRVIFTWLQGSVPWCAGKSNLVNKPEVSRESLLDVKRCYSSSANFCVSVTRKTSQHMEQCEQLLYLSSGFIWKIKKRFPYERGKGEMFRSNHNQEAAPQQTCATSLWGLLTGNNYMGAVKDTLTNSNTKLISLAQQIHKPSFCPS